MSSHGLGFQGLRFVGGGHFGGGDPDQIFLWGQAEDFPGIGVEDLVDGGEREGGIVRIFG